MVYLCFVNGRNQDEMVRIIEGEDYEIDRLTANQINSAAIRKKYCKQFLEFQSKYPHAKDGAVRIYGDGIYSENGKRVIYQKHRIAFNHIITDKHFLRWSCNQDLDGDKKDRVIYDTYILRGIAQFGLETTRINQFIKSIKKRDRNDTGLTGGSRRYYIFMRQLLNRYETYRKIYHKPSIDDIWHQHLENLETMSLQKEKKSLSIVMPEEVEIDIEEDTVDEDYYRLSEEPVFKEPLYEFFVGDMFERYYERLLRDHELIVVTCFSRTKDNEKKEIIAEVTDACFTGTVTSANLELFTLANLEDLNRANTVIIYVEEDTKYLKQIVIQATQNKSDIIFISDEPSLLEQYSKRFKNIVLIYDSDEEHLEVRKQLAEYFKEQYQQSRGYKKT